MTRRMTAIIAMMGLLAAAGMAGADEKGAREGKAPKETGIEVIVIPADMPEVDVIPDISLDDLTGGKGKFYAVGAKGRAVKARPKAKPGPDVKALHGALSLQKQFVALMANPLLSAQLAITRIKDMALASKKVQLGAKMLQVIAARADHVAIRRSALFALSELHEKSGNPAEAIEVMTLVAKVPQAPPRPQAKGADATATEARRVNRWLREHPELARKIIANFMAQGGARPMLRKVPRGSPMPGAPARKPGRMMPGASVPRPMPGAPTGRPGRMMPGRGMAMGPRAVAPHGMMPGAPRRGMMPGAGVPPHGMMPGAAGRGMMRGGGMAMRPRAVAPHGMMRGRGVSAPRSPRPEARRAPTRPRTRTGGRRKPTVGDFWRRFGQRRSRRSARPETRDPDRRTHTYRGWFRMPGPGAVSPQRGDKDRRDRDRGDRRPRDKGERRDRDRPVQERGRRGERSEGRQGIRWMAESDVRQMKAIPKGVRVYVHREGESKFDTPYVRRLGEGQRPFHIVVRPPTDREGKTRYDIRQPEARGDRRIRAIPSPEGAAQGRGWIRVRPSPEGRRPDVHEDRLRALMQRIERQERELDEKAKMLEARVKELNRWEAQLKRRAEDLKRDDKPKPDRRERPERRREPRERRDDEDGD